MKPIRLLAAATAFALLLPAISIAQPDQRRGDDRSPHGANDRPGASHREGPPQRSAPQDQRDARGRGDDRHAANDERGAGPDHAFRRGGRLPADYRSRQYVVDDWRGHHLSAPPRGYHWVQTGADYVLVAVATGIIAQILLSN